MFPKSVRYAGRVESMDEYLQSMGLWRKVIPKDGASLYRVVAEQVRSYSLDVTWYVKGAAVATGWQIWGRNDVPDIQR